MNSEKCRTKAMKIAATTDGTYKLQASNSVAIEGSDKDQLVVVGESVDSANLTRSLRKKALPCRNNEGGGSEAKEASGIYLLSQVIDVQSISTISNVL
jgi:hypothetical protein